MGKAVKKTHPPKKAHKAAQRVRNEQQQHAHQDFKLQGPKVCESRIKASQCPFYVINPIC